VGTQAAASSSKRQPTAEEKKAKEELLRKYGNQRLESSNPYDVVDAFSVLVNNPDIDEAAREADDREANAELVTDPFGQPLEQRLKVANYSEEEVHRFKTEYERYSKDVKGLGFDLRSQATAVQEDDRSASQYEPLPSKKVKTEV
jgi:hypothetical protein